MQFIKKIKTYLFPDKLLTKASIKLLESIICLEMNIWIITLDTNKNGTVDSKHFIWNFQNSES